MTIRSAVVRSADIFRVHLVGLRPQVHHEPKQGGNIVAWYAVASDDEGDMTIEVLSRHEFARRRARVTANAGQRMVQRMLEQRLR